MSRGHVMINFKYRDYQTVTILLKFVIITYLPKKWT